MKKLILILFLVSILISSCATTSQTSSERPIFSSDEYSVKSFKKNSKGYILTFSSVAGSVPNGAMVHIMVAKNYPSGSGEGREYKKGTMKYQFGNLNIPEKGEFSIEFGIGIPNGNQLKIRSKVLFRNITIDDIENNFSLYEPETNIENLTASEDFSLADTEFVLFTPSENVILPDDKPYAGSVNVQSGRYLNSRNSMILKDDSMGENYAGNGIRHKAIFKVNYERSTWSLQIDSDKNGFFEDDEKVTGNYIEISDLKIIFRQDKITVAYLVHYDMGYELYAYLGGKSYLIFLEYKE